MSTTHILGIILGETDSGTLTIGTSKAGITLNVLSGQTSYTAISGTITLTQNDASATKETFSCTAVKSTDPSKTITIENGSFECYK